MTSETFENSNVMLGETAHISDMTLTPLAPQHARAAMITHVILSLIPVTAFSAIALLGSSEKIGFLQGITFWLPFLAVLGLFNFYLFSEVKSRRYGLRTHDVAYRKGLIWRSLIVVPFARTQHVELHHGPIDRSFGLASIKIFTAGGMTADMEIHGLLEADAQALRSYLLERIGAEETNAPLATEPPEEATENDFHNTGDQEAAEGGANEEAQK